MKLHDYLSQNQLTERQFADLIGKSPATVNRWRHGLVTPSIDVLMKIKQLTDGLVCPEDFSDDG